jgi:hypothetical protein
MQLWIILLCLSTFKTSIARHVELQNVAGLLMEQPLEQTLEQN